jgi:hypothetical protein
MVGPFKRHLEIIREEEVNDGLGRVYGLGK